MCLNITEENRSRHESMKNRAKKALSKVITEKVGAEFTNIKKLPEFDASASKKTEN